MQSSTSKKTMIGKRLAELRRKMGFASPQALADAIADPAITKNVIINIEQGRKSDITITEAMHIAKALRIPLPMLIVDVKHPFDNSDVRGFEQYTNADVLDLFSFAKTRYGMIRREDPQNGFVMLHFFERIPFIPDASDLWDIYEALNLLATGLHDYALYVSNAAAAERRGDSTEIYQAAMQLVDAKDNIRDGLTGLAKFNVPVPSEITEMAHDFLRTKLVAGNSDVDFEELWSSTKRTLQEQNLLGIIAKAAKELQRDSEENNVQGMD